MTATEIEWEPRIGEIAWIHPETRLPSEFNSDAHDRLLDHFPLVLHVTPGQDAKKRYVWFIVVSHALYQNF